MKSAYRELYYPLQLLLRLSIIYGLFTLCRLAFYAVNQASFPEISGLGFGGILLAALRFDTAAIIYINALFVLSYLLPIPWRAKSWYQSIQVFLFLTFNFFALLLELIDVGFFSFSFRRSGASDLTMIANSFQLTPRYLLDYWYLLLLLLLSVWGMYHLYQRLRLTPPPGKTRFWSQFLVFLAGVLLSIIAARGGLQLRPIMPISATEYVQDMRLAPLVSNTTLSIIFSSQQRFLQVPSYYSPEELDLFFPPRHIAAKQDSLEQKNVVLIVLESFGKESVGYFNPEKPSNTPFFDSLLAKSWTSKTTLSNGLRSTQGIVAITAGIPSLMEDPLMFSAYQSNRVDGLAALLGKKGYTTGFFHGSNPGSMEFERFAQLSGFQHFYDKTAYPDQSDYDGNWGIWDAPFFQFFAETLNDYQGPFLGLIFSLTSHHPYAVEDWFAQKYPDMDIVDRSYLYTDHALRQFFERARQMPWYSKTLFVIAADHVGPQTDESGNTKASRYQIPICFFDPSADTIPPHNPVLQQIDILPSVLDHLQYDEAYSSFGQSFFNPQAPSYGYMYAEGLYQIVDEQFLLLFDGQKTTALYRYISDPLLQTDVKWKEQEIVQKMESQLKAVIQKHHWGMVKNRLVKNY